MTLILRATRAFPPTTPVDIDRRWLQYKPKLVIAPAFGTRDLFGQALTFANDAVRQGAHYEFPGVNGYIDFGSTGFVALGTHTVLACTMLDSFPTNYPIIAGYNTTSTRASLFYSNNVSYFDLSWGLADGSAGSNNTRFAMPSGLSVTNQWHNFVLRGNGGSNLSSARAWVNGLEMAGSASSNHAIISSNNTLGQAGTGSLTNDYDGRMRLFVLFDSQLPAPVCQALSSNPWQLFAPLRRRIWVPAPAGADVSTALTGSAATTSAGTVTPSTSVAAAGEAATASAGSLVPSSSLALAGEAATASAGTLTQGSSVALSGEASTAAAGTLAPSVTIGLTGESVTASAGTITYNASGDTSVALSGQAVTASAGTLAPSLSLAATGQAATASAGTVACGTSLACSGTELVTAAGTLTLGISVSLAGQAAAASAGTITYQEAGTVSVALTGSEVTASAGTLTFGRGEGLSAAPIGHGPPVGRRLPLEHPRRGPFTTRTR